MNRGLNSMPITPFWRYWFYGDPDSRSGRIKRIPAPPLANATPWIFSRADIPMPGRIGT